MGPGKLNLLALLYVAAEVRQDLCISSDPLVEM